MRKLDSDDKNYLARKAALQKTVGLSTWRDWKSIMHYKLPQTLFAIRLIAGRNWYSLVVMSYSSDLFDPYKNGLNGKNFISPDACKST